MNKLFVVSALLVTFQGCALMSNQATVRPSDVLADKTARVGTSGNVSGFVECHDDYCRIIESKNGLGITEGSSVYVKIDKLNTKDKKFLITKCTIGESCTLVVSGKFVKYLSNDIALEASAIEKIGTTKLKYAFD